MIDRIKNAHERAAKIEELIHQQAAQGWDYLNAIGTVKQETILVFEEISVIIKLYKEIMR